MNKKLTGNEFINLCNTTQNLGSCINTSVDVDLINNVSRNMSLQNVYNVSQQNVNQFRTTDNLKNLSMYIKNKQQDNIIKNVNKITQNTSVGVKNQ